MRVSFASARSDGFGRRTRRSAPQRACMCTLDDDVFLRGKVAIREKRVGVVFVISGESCISVLWVISEDWVAANDRSLDVSTANDDDSGYEAF